MKKRIDILDALRGFSLLGILIANMLYFQYDFVSLDAVQPDIWWDKVAYYFTKIFVEGSFVPIFGFLFGYGIILFARSLENRELSTRGPLWRRAIGLVILGCLHITFVWDGDILLSYGSGLLIFMLFIKRKVKTMLIWAVVLTLCMMPILLVKTDFLAIILTDMKETVDVLKNGTYLEVVKQRVSISDDLSIIFMVIVLPIMLGFMAIFSFFAMGPLVLLGMAAAKVDFFKRIGEKMDLLKRLSLLIPVGLLCKALLDMDHFVGELLYSVGTYMLAIGYIAAFTLVFISVKENKISQAFVNLGRLSLTNYLMQSIICTTIFYGYGLGFFGELGVALGLVIAVVVYSLQLLLANWYGQRFSMGPVEWALRKFVYRKNFGARNEHNSE
ncbi:DUF418 domain-containing protein [Psychrobacillus sp.]|uniref:DUF418 domain-containing protein n=1 Tax=Psychrobacillus sp. TaxID=1871623 RepID=UPI0028BD9C0E|nr:DUF418 domain-containing protein [Psychrobacillus sp.]